MPDPTPVRTDPAEAARQAADALGVAFDDEGPYSREMTASALAALGTCAYYLRVCLGDAHPAAIPAVDALAVAADALAEVHDAAAARPTDTTQTAGGDS